VSEQAERRAELAMALVPVALVALTLLVLIEPRVAPAVVNDRLALVIDAATTLVAVAVAGLAWVHYQEGPDPAALVRARPLDVTSNSDDRRCRPNHAALSPYPAGPGTISPIRSRGGAVACRT
jgi:hypothetical protein